MLLRFVALVVALVVALLFVDLVAEVAAVAAPAVAAGKGKPPPFLEEDASGGGTKDMIRIDGRLGCSRRWSKNQWF